MDTRAPSRQPLSRSGLAGAGLCLLRAASGSLLAPVLVHWAANGLGVLAVEPA